MSDSPSTARQEMQQARHKTAIAIGVIVGLLAFVWMYFIKATETDKSAEYATAPRNVAAMIRALTGLAMVLFATVAAASAPRAIILPTQIQGGAFAGKKTLPQELNLRLIAHIQRFGFVVMGPELLSLAESKCRDEQCMRAITKNLGVELVVRASLENTDRSAPAFRVELERFDTRATPAHRLDDETCVGCSALEAADMVARILDDSLKPPAPVPAPVVAVVPASPSTRPRWWRPTFFSLGAIGVAATFAGAVALGIKGAQYGDPFCDDSFPAGRACPYGRDTRPALIAAGTIAVVGVALTITGFVLATRKSRR